MEKPDSTFGSQAKTWLAGVNLLGGLGDYPCYKATLRAAFRLADDPVDQVVSETVALRSLMMSAMPQNVKLEPGSAKLHVPLLLRLHAAAYEKGGKNSLEIGGMRGTLAPAPGQDYGDLLATPASAAWPKQDNRAPDPGDPDAPENKPSPEISIPALRLQGGAASVLLELDKNKPLIKFLRADKSSMFGGLVPVTSGDRALPVRLVAEGVEFDGALPDPTSGAKGAAAASIEGRFRLEYDPTRSAGGYYLRLVARPGAARGPMDALEARIGAVFGDLALEADSPLVISMDRRAVAPPLLWPLVLKDDRLSLIPAAGAAGHFEMEIDRAAVAVRLRTRSNYPDEATGLAALQVERIGWIRTAAGFDLRLTAGTLGAEQLTLAFAKNQRSGWDTTFEATSSSVAVTVPLYEQGQRVNALYKEARAVEADARQAPYLYFPITDGWLQLALPAGKETTESLPAAGTRQASVLSGKIVAGTGTGRAVRIRDAGALLLTMQWVMMDGALRAQSGQLQVSEAHAIFRGFLYAAETSPTAAEALPDLRRGPGATRDMPVHLGASPQRLELAGRFSWKAADNSWNLDVDALRGTQIDPVKNPDPSPNYAWLPAGANPFVSKYPLTRSVAAATEPSLSRGLLPYKFGQQFSLALAANAALPTLTAKTPLAWDGLFQDSGPAFRNDTLVLPTLAGVEFYPTAPAIPASLDAALRFDLPQLDELFAWSDPPREKGVKPAAGAAPAPAVTTLDMPRLRDAWEASRVRMALTRTQSAFASPWVKVGGTSNIDVKGLVEPYAWHTSFGVDLAKDLYGRYQLGGKDYLPQEAVAGLDGVSFAVNGTALVPDANGPIRVAGFAASLFTANGGQLADSRGFAMAPSATASGRAATCRFLTKDTPPKFATREFVLFTMPSAFRIDSGVLATDGHPELGFAGDLHFYARDLTIDGTVFDGTANPVESAPGTTGQAYLPANLPGSLHEWRFFESPGKDGVRRHDIGCGPFRFKPLRLVRAEFGAGGAPILLKVMGSMRLDQDPAHSLAASTPFGPDEVYRGGDLFELSLSYASQTGKWRSAWRAVAVRADDKTGLLAIEPRAGSGIRASVLLHPAGKGIQSHDGLPVPATVEFDLVNTSATLTARLFGTTATLFCEKYTSDANGIELSFLASKPVPHTKRENGVWLAGFAPCVRIGRNGATLKIDGSLVAMAPGADLPGADTALAVFGSDTWRWLDLEPDSDSARANLELSVDHRTGAVSGSWRATVKGAPLFGLLENEYAAAGRIQALAETVPITENNISIAMASAWMRIYGAAGSGEALDHRLRLDTAGSEHWLDLSGMIRVDSPIRWPLDGLVKDSLGGAGLDLASDEWIDPGRGKVPLKPLSRVLGIRADAPLASHSVLLRLSRHRLDAAQLACTGGSVIVRKAVHLLAVAEHTLSQDKRKASWTTLDHVTITTAAAICAATELPGAQDPYYFAPRYRTGKYRAHSDWDDIARGGIIPMRLALAGFYDPLMVSALWKMQAQDKPLLLGGAAIQLRLEEGEGSLVAVMPWARLPGETAELSQRGGVWHVPAVELWAGHALDSMESLPTLGMPPLVAAPELARRLDSAGLTAPELKGAMADPLPVEQAWFEKWTGAPAPMNEQDLSRAPFFLRTLLVLARRWRHDGEANSPGAQGKAFRWNVASLHPCRTDALRKPANNEGPSLFRVEMGEEMPWQLPYREPVTLVPADLTVLSRTEARFLSAYRLVAQASADAPVTASFNAVLVDRALDENRTAVLAIQEVSDADGAPAVFVARIPIRLDDWLAPFGPELRRIAELPPSAALGWPSDAALAALERMGPRLDDELSVLAPHAGFSGRFQRFGWPALAVRAGETGPNLPEPAPQAYYLSFANRIAYDRNTRLAFDGPPARHLAPAPVRRRAPVVASVTDTLAGLAGNVDLAAPLLLPGIERATLGRRPGVFEVAVASLTVPGDSGEFDTAQARFGRPANAGPLIAQQLRTPRSPLLPDDQDDADIAVLTARSPLAFRRRTWLSEADTDGQDRLALFSTFEGSVDVLRFGTGSAAVRVALTALDELIGPAWQGTIEVAVDARDQPGHKGGNEIAKLKLARAARLEVGSQTFELTEQPPCGPSAAFSWECKDLAKVREALRLATADTPLRLVFGVAPRDHVETAGTLADAGIRFCTIRLALDPGMRSVLPVRSTTIAFGDPSYDRQLASPTRMDARQIEDSGKANRRVVLAADRKEYDPAATLYFACGAVDRESGLFSEAGNVSACTLRMRRSRKADKPDAPVVTVALALRNTKPDERDAYPFDPARAYAIVLSELHAPGEDAGRAALEPDDTLTLLVTYSDKAALTVDIDIVAEPVIAPAPAVYSVLGGDRARKRMAVVLHAAGPLPQRVEFEDLERDLALGQIRRRALFIWRWASVGTTPTDVKLVKFDRSGGTQLPD